jgi:hypothetical protein
MKRVLHTLFSIIGLIICATPYFARAQNYSPEQTAQMWLSALRRNDANAMALLGSTPEQYLAFVDQAKAECGKEADLIFFDNVQSPDAKDRYFALLQPYLASANQWRDEYADISKATLEDIDTETQLSIEQQQAAREVGLATLNWAQRTDFSSEARLKNAIGVLIDESRLYISTPETCTQLNQTKPLKRADHLVRLVKGVLKAYDFNLDTILSTMKVSAEKQYLDNDKNHRAKIRISYQVFEARGFVIVDMKRQGDQWFFTESMH